MKFKVSILLFLFCKMSLAMNTPLARDTTFMERSIVLQTATGNLMGTLTLPDISNNIPVALLIAGSGPTDRNGNGPGTTNDCLKEIAHELANQGIASVRYDKRGIGESKEALKVVADLRFDTYVTDAKSWISLLKKDNRFSRVVVIGHSEGALIGMLAAQSSADSYVSIAGAGRSADKLLKVQLAAQPLAIKEQCYSIIDSLVIGKTVDKVNPDLYALFRPNVQPYLINWFHYDPVIEIKKLQIPVLLVQGKNDLQVSIDDAQLLAKAKPTAKLILIDNMNHVLKTVNGDLKANMAAYNNPGLPISSELAQSIISFIKNTK